MRSALFRRHEALQLLDQFCTTRISRAGPSGFAAKKWKLCSSRAPTKALPGGTSNIDAGFCHGMAPEFGNRRAIINPPRARKNTEAGRPADLTRLTQAHVEA